MLRSLFFLIFCAVALHSFGAAATSPPDQTATIIVHGFFVGGGRSEGVFGADESPVFIADRAAFLGLPTSDVAPFAMNQVASTTYYGDQYPPYYTAADIADIEAVTALHGGGVPRYAMIIAKYAKEVMRRSGAVQVNIYAESFGGLVSRYMIEKDLEGLASSGKIARWICAVGLVSGNFTATLGGPAAQTLFENFYGAEPKDLEHMHYDWVKKNINNPRTSSKSAFLGGFPVHFWQGADDNENAKSLTLTSNLPNDGVQLIDDAVLRNLPSKALYLGRIPTLSATHTTHNTFTGHRGYHAGLRAQLFGRTRVTITLEDVRALKEFDGGLRGDGEYIFGVKVYSPTAEAQFGVTEPIHDLRAEDNNLPFIRMPAETTKSLNLIWFDDMVLPGETSLRLVSRVDESDGDLIYNIAEPTNDSITNLADSTLDVSVVNPGLYTMETDDWRGTVRVQIQQYQPFGEAPPKSAARHWSLYQ